MLQLLPLQNILEIDLFDVFVLLLLGIEKSPLLFLLLSSPPFSCYLCFSFLCLCCLFFLCFFLFLFCSCCLFLLYFCSFFFLSFSLFTSNARGWCLSSCDGLGFYESLPIHVQNFVPYDKDPQVVQRIHHY